MFQFTSKAKILAVSLIALGAIAWIIGFTATPGGHSESENHMEVHATHADHDGTHDQNAHVEHSEGHDAHGSHGDHDLHQMQNRPWSALLVNSIFFLAIGLGTLFFLTVNYAANSGWTVGLNRIMEAVALFVLIPLIGIIALVFTGVADVHHIWHWMQDGIMTKGSPNYDSIIAGKEGYLNDGFFIVRTLIYAIVWYLVIVLIRRNSRKEDVDGGTRLYKKNITISAFFLVFYGVTSSTSAWDWIMSIDTHWFSTLFGWYTFVGFFVTALAVLNLLVVFLRYNKYIPWINENHQHDLAKYMFAFSIFWTYLWFSQFMLIWYANIPEEVTYYMQRFDDYGLWFAIMVTLNFAFPVLLVMSRDSKRIMSIVTITSVFVLIGHWLDHYIMVMPGTVGLHFGFGLPELGGLLFYAGLFIWAVFRSLSKAPLLQKNHPLLTESKHFHL